MKEERESIAITRTKADGEPCAWRAEVRNTQAGKECAKRGFKCIYAATLQEVTARICDWRQAPEIATPPITSELQPSVRLSCEKRV